MDQHEKEKILIVDDDDFLLDMYALKFREAGFDVDVASKAEDALEKFRKGDKPNILLLDIIMPKMDGFDFLAILKKEKLLGPECRIVILTNLGQKSDIEKGLRLGADDYFVKAHHTPSEIVEKVENLLLKDLPKKSEPFDYAHDKPLGE